MGNSEKIPQRSPSVNTLKLFGKKLMGSKGHVEQGSYIESSAGNAIAPNRRRPHSPSDSSGSSSANVLNVGNRHRSPSLLSKTLKREQSSSSIHPVKSTAAIQNLIGHSTNPFVAEAAAKESAAAEASISRRQINRRQTSDTLNKRSPQTPHRSKSFATHHAPSNLPKENLIYNPYGINPNGSRPGTAFADSTNKDNDLSFYLHDGSATIRMLPLPIQDPNEFLPEHMKQFSVHLTDNFIFDTDNKPIGSGGSSEVRKVISAYRKKDVYALKKLNMIYNETPEKFYKRCSKEFIIAKQLSHNIHITRTFLLLKVPTTTYTTRGWGFIMELGVKDLFQLIERSGWKGVPLNEKFCIFKQIANAIKFCHEQGIAHRDLKPENVLLSKDGICKLTDFGISDWYHVEPNNFDSPVKRCEGMIGSPPFTPPEVMVYDAKKHISEKHQKPYNPVAMDCYALGILLFTLVNNIIPFIESWNSDPRFREFENSYENFIQYQNPQFREKDCHKAGPGGEYSLARNFKSTDASRVAWRLSDPNPDTRYTMDELYNDPWFQSIETCVDPHDDTYLVKAPEIKKSSTNTLELTGNESFTDLSLNTRLGAETQSIVSGSPTTPQDTNSELIGAAHTMANSDSITGDFTPTAVIKPRSMVEIAEAPLVLPKGPKKVSSRTASSNHKNLFTLDEEDKDGVKSNALIGFDEQDTNASEVEHTVDSIMDKPTPSSTFQDVASVNTTPDRKQLISSNSNPQMAPLTSKMNDLSLGGSTSKSASSISTTKSISAKKRVIHNHLDVPASVTQGSSMRSMVSR